MGAVTRAVCMQRRAAVHIEAKLEERGIKLGPVVPPKGAQALLSRAYTPLQFVFTHGPSEHRNFLRVAEMHSLSEPPVHTVK